MPTLTITYQTPEERRAYERAIAFVAEMHRIGLGAPDGGVIDACESVALSQNGRGNRGSLDRLHGSGLISAHVSAALFGVFP